MHAAANPRYQLAGFQRLIWVWNEIRQLLTETEIIHRRDKKHPIPKNNITLYNENYTNEELEQVLEYTNACQFINKYDDGILEEVAEAGSNLSAGQRQLISFSRTLIRKPSILVLDEATANIDSETEVLIQDALEKMMNIGTMLIVAHRLSTIQNSDIIFVVENGKIVEEGNHKELLEQQGKYYDYYMIQVKKDELT